MKPNEGDAGVIEQIKNKLKDLESIVKNKEYTKDDVDAALDFLKENPGMIDNSIMDKLYSAMDAGHQKEYLKSVLKDLQSQPEMMDEDMKVIIDGMTQIEAKNMDSKETELTTQLEISNKEKETLTTERDGLLTDVSNMKEQLKVFEQKEADTLKTMRETQWTAIKNKIPTGLVADEAAEKAMREKFESDPHAFAVTLTEIKNTEAPKEEEGVEVVNQSDKVVANKPMTDKAISEALTEVGIPSIDFGGME